MSAASSTLGYVSYVNLVLLRFKMYYFHSKFVNTEQNNCLGVQGVRGVVLRLVFFVLPGANLVLID